LATQERLEEVRDENVSLKLRISELESEIIEERDKTRVKFDLNLEVLKS